MPLPVVSKVLRVDLIQTLGGDTNVRNHLYFAYAGVGPTVSDLNTLCDTIGTAWSTNFGSHVSNGTSLTSIEITDLTSTTAAQTQKTESHSGTAGTPDPPAGLAMVIRFKIARRYRGGHPRFYLAGILASNLATAQTWNSSAVTALASAFASFITACTTSPPTNVGAMSHSNVSYYNGFTVLAPSGRRAKNVPTLRSSPVVDQVLSYSVNPNVGSQRRRNEQR